MHHQFDHQPAWCPWSCCLVLLIYQVTLFQVYVWDCFHPSVGFSSTLITATVISLVCGCAAVSPTQVGCGGDGDNWYAGLSDCLNQRKVNWCVDECLLKSMPFGSGAVLFSEIGFYAGIVPHSGIFLGPSSWVAAGSDLWPCWCSAVVNLVVSLSLTQDLLPDAGQWEVILRLMHS